MPSTLDSLSRLSIVVADTGDLEAISRWRPRDATTNPSLLLAAASDPRYGEVIRQAVAGAKDSETAMERLFVRFGTEILGRIEGRVSTEVDARLSFDVEGTIAKAKKFRERYAAAGIPADRLLVKIAATWEGIKAAERLEREGIHCNLTLLFSFAQAVACAEAGVTLISPFVGRIYDWHRAARRVDDIAIENDPGVASVSRIYAYYKRHGYRTQVMGASFRKTEQVLALAGCDLLTIAPDLLQKLAATSTAVERRLSVDSASGSAGPRLRLDEKAWRWMHNEDAMAVEKLSEGIRKFDADARKLESLISTFSAAQKTAAA